MLKKIATFCKRVRRANGRTQLDVSLDTGYSVSNVSEFENGRNNNAIILSWYMRIMSDDERRKIAEMWEAVINDNGGNP